MIDSKEDLIQRLINDLEEAEFLTFANYGNEQDGLEELYYLLEKRLSDFLIIKGDIL